MESIENINTNRLSIYLIKPQYQLLDDMLKQPDNTVTIPEIGTFAFGQSFPQPPSWLRKFFGDRLSNVPQLLVSSAKGVLLISINYRGVNIFFAISFGTGRYLLKDGIIEERFGLKVALNSVSASSFRKIDKMTLGSVPKHSNEQMSREVSPAEFGIDPEQDLISSITGKSNYDFLGKIVTGRDALSVSVKVDITNIQTLLEQCYDRYLSSDYKRDFDWIDQITAIRDQRIENLLNTALIDKLVSENYDKTWMAVPEVIDWSDVEEFRYLRRVRGNPYDDINLFDFISELEGRSITLDILQDSIVYMISASSGIDSGRWSAFKCMYSEIELRGKLYVLTNGKWYEIAQGFTAQVQRDFDSLNRSTIDFPDCTENKEGEYNERIASIIPNSCCMDRRLIRHGGGNSSIEFCDLYSMDKKIIHIKKYGGSSVLSHLFSQGVVSGELLVSDQEFRKKLKRLLPQAYRATIPNVRPSPPTYEVIYGIIHDGLDPLDLPFFSKVSLRSARRRLESYGYTVSIKHIKKV